MTAIKPRWKFATLGKLCHMAMCLLLRTSITLGGTLHGLLTFVQNSKSRGTVTLPPPTPPHPNTWLGLQIAFPDRRSGSSAPDVLGVLRIVRLLQDSDHDPGVRLCKARGAYIGNPSDVRGNYYRAGKVADQVPATAWKSWQPRWVQERPLRPPKVSRRKRNWPGPPSRQSSSTVATHSSTY